jgi:hypothetical protein
VREGLKRVWSVTAEFQIRDADPRQRAREEPLTLRDGRPHAEYAVDERPILPFLKRESYWSGVMGHNYYYLPNTYCLIGAEKPRLK